MGLPFFSGMIRIEYAPALELHPRVLEEFVGCRFPAESAYGWSLPGSGILAPVPDGHCAQRGAKVRFATVLRVLLRRTSVAPAYLRRNARRQDTRGKYFFFPEECYTLLSGISFFADDTAGPTAMPQA